MLVFLHGLDSSGNGTKGRFFGSRYPQMLRPDFTGDFAERMTQLESLLVDCNDLVLVGSSYGGLLATAFASEHPGRVRRLVLLAPAFNFADFSPYSESRIKVETYLFIGKNDVVTPEDEVVPVARRVFADLKLSVVDDDHFLHQVFPHLDWAELLDCQEAG